MKKKKFHKHIYYTNILCLSNETATEKCEIPID